MLSDQLVLQSLSILLPKTRLLLVQYIWYNIIIHNIDVRVQCHVHVLCVCVATGRGERSVFWTRGHFMSPTAEPVDPD